MKALTIKQPWAHAILHLGKNVENRSWQPPRQLIGQYIAIHAGKGFDRTSGVDIPPDDVVRGAIVGIARIAGVRENMRSRWFEGPYGWLLDDVRQLRRPIACRGLLGLWSVPEESVRKIRRAFPDVASAIVR